MMTALGHFIVSHTQWLYTRLWESPVFFIDLWSVAHAWSGFVLMALAVRLRVGRAWWSVGAVLMAYELVELGFIAIAFHAFHPESLKDQLTDLAVGFAGAAVARRVCSPRVSDAFRASFTPVLAGGTIAFVWVGSYGYVYSAPAFNSPGLNAWAFALWTALLAFLGFFERTLRTRLPRATGRFASSTFMYAAILGVAEYLGHWVFEIREVGHPGALPLAMGLIHGTPALHAFYVTAPLWAALAHRALAWLLARPLSVEVAAGAGDGVADLRAGAAG